MASESMLRRSRKIRLILTDEQEQIVESWFGVSRYVYNMTIEYLGLLDKDDAKIGYYDLRFAIMQLLPEWAMKCPVKIRQSAVKDAHQAVKMAKVKGKKSGKYQRTRFRSKRTPTQSVGMTSEAYGKKGLFGKILGENFFAEELPNKPTDGRIIREYGIYYVITCVEVQQMPIENQEGIVALDPGIRTFINFFSHDAIGKLGEKANIRIQALCERLDRVISEISLEANSRRKHRLLKVKDRIQKRIKDLTRELHYKVARYLCSRYEYILLPSFETSEMVKKDGRVLRSKTARQMNTLSFYQFSLRLKNIAEKMSVNVVDVTEEYTSKTVSWTGEIINGLGGSKTIKSQDGETMDRDYNGARNIYIKYISENLV